MMLPRPLQPLVPLSALALLGWCWYSFRRKRSAGVEVEEGGMAGGRSAASSTTSVSRLDKQGIAARHGIAPTGHVGSSSINGDQDLNMEVSDYSSLSSFLSVDKSVLCGSSPADSLISSPSPRLLKGARPEPEGGISEGRATALLAEKPEAEKPEAETENDFACKSQPCFRARHILKEQEQLPSSLGKDVLCATAEEILVSSDAVLKRKHQEEPWGSLPSEVETVAQDPLQKDISKNGSLLVTRKDLRALKAQDPTALSGAVEERSSQPEGPSSADSEEDPGRDACHMENRAGLEEPANGGEACSAQPEEGALATSSVDSECTTHEIHHAVAGRSRKNSTQSAGAPKGANGAIPVNGEGGGNSRDGAALPPSSALTLWEVEVPAHLVGRLIGKRGKHVGFLNQNTGAKVYVSTLPYTHEFQICHIEGSEVQVENVLALIRKKFKDLDLSNRRGGMQLAPLPSLPITSWLLLPQERTVEVVVPRVEAANYLFVQQHTHPTYYALQGLAEQMLFCYSQPGCPSLPAPVEVGVLCAAPSADGSWWRAQVIQCYKNSKCVQIRYVDYGGYVTVNLSALRQIRSDFVSLPFQASEVMLENIAPLPGREELSVEAKEALEELTQGVTLIIKVTGTRCGLPLVHMWRPVGDEMVLVNGLLVERGLCSWLDSH